MEEGYRDVGAMELVLLWVLVLVGGRLGLVVSREAERPRERRMEVM